MYGLYPWTLGLEECGISVAGMAAITGLNVGNCSEELWMLLFQDDNSGTAETGLRNAEDCVSDLFIKFVGVGVPKGEFDRESTVG